MADPAPQHTLPPRPVGMGTVLEWALGLRVLAAVVVHEFALGKGVLCVFPDTRIYWLLAGTIRDGESYKVLQWGDIPYFAIRTPGYPLFLAGCRLLFGDRLLPVRLVPALLGAACVWLVARLTDRATPGHRAWRGWTVAMLAAALAAFDPFQVATSALVLSEAVFIPLMLLTL